MNLFTIRSINKFFVALFFISIVNTNAQGLSASIGADIVSRYIWRGIDINATPNVQPSFALSAAGFELGFWGSYTISNLTLGTDEIDAYLSYSFGTEAGDFSILLTDYYFPNAGTRLGKFEDGGGAHTLEIGFGYGGPASFPISLFAGYNFYNDPGNNVYFEFDYPFSVSDIEFNFFVGGTIGSKDNPAYYGSDGFAIINVGISGTKEVKVTDDFSIPLTTGLIVNPKVDIAHLVFGISL